jgi:hypothetical protein
MMISDKVGDDEVNFKLCGCRRTKQISDNVVCKNKLFLSAIFFKLHRQSLAPPAAGRKTTVLQPKQY